MSRDGLFHLCLRDLLAIADYPRARRERAQRSLAAGQENRMTWAGPRRRRTELLDQRACTARIARLQKAVDHIAAPCDGLLAAAAGVAVFEQVVATRQS